MISDRRSLLPRLAAVLALFMLAAGSWFLQAFATARPDVLPANAPQGSFSAERAEQVLTRILGPEKPHPVSSAENIHVRDRIVSELSRLRLRPSLLHGFACHSPHDYGVLICATVTDVIAQVKPGQGKAIVLLAHYDSVPAGPGAADDESGVATVIETARALLAQRLPGRHPIMAVLTDGEEADLLGAAAFLNNAALKAGVGAVVNVEARGNRGPSLLFQTSTGDGPLIDLYASETSDYATSSLYHEIYRFLPNDTDLTLFIADGFPSFNFAYIGGVADYHTAEDVRANLDLASLQQQGDNMLGVVTGLGKTEFARLHGHDDVYFDILGRWLPRMPVGLAIPLALVAFVGTLIASILMRKERTDWRVWLRAFAVAPALILLALFSGFLLHAIASLISGTPDPAYAYPAAFRIALALALGGSSLLVTRIAPARLSATATWLWISAMGITVALFLPGFSPYFVFPSLVAAVALTISARARNKSVWIVGTFIAALCALLVWSSIGTLGEMIMGLKLHPLFTVPFALALATLVPLIARCELPRSIWIAGTTAFVVLAITASVIQGFEPTFSIDTPQRLSITYVQDRTKSEWSVDAFAPVPQAMRAVAKFAAKAQRVSDFWGGLSYVAPAGSARLDLPTATIIARPLSGGLRQVSLGLHGSRAAAQMYVVIPATAGLRSIDVGDWHADAPINWAKKSAVAIACMSQDCADKSITLTLASRSTADLQIYEHRFGLPDFARQLVAARPPTAAPSQNGDGVTLVNTVTIPGA